MKTPEGVCNKFVKHKTPLSCSLSLTGKRVKVESIFVKCNIFNHLWIIMQAG